MVYITSNSPKLCSFSEIYNDIVKENDIKSPTILSNLKMNLAIVMRQLDSSYSNVNVVKTNNSFYVGYDNNDDQESIKIEIDSDDTERPIDRSIFNFIIDNDIDYHVTAPDNEGNTLLHYGVLYDDEDRIIKLVSKYKLSFFTKNFDGIRPIDNISSIKILKVIIEQHENKNYYLENKVEFLCANNSHLKNIFSDIYDELNKLKKFNTYLFGCLIVYIIFQLIYNY
jgi:hypothetical protein